jgi:hypothetical protein
MNRAARRIGSRVRDLNEPYVRAGCSDFIDLDAKITRQRVSGPHMTPKNAQEDYLHDAIQWIVHDAIERHNSLPDPIAWVEPSINGPYLESCMSYVFGCGLASTITLGALLEHIIRLAAVDMEFGRPFAMSEAIWDKYKRFTIAQFHNQGILETIVDKQDLDWWVSFAGDRIRNKTVHLDIPMMIHDLGRFEQYVGIYRDTDSRELIFSSRYWWGAPFHHTNDLVAIGFLRESTEKLERVIHKLKWPEFRDHWISQKWRYDSFFQKHAVGESLRRCYKANPIRNLIDFGI